MTSIHEQQNFHDPASNVQFQLTRADLFRFLISSKEMGLSLEDFESIFQEIIDRVVEGTDDSLPSRDLKIYFKFLQNLLFFFKGMIKIG